MSNSSVINNEVISNVVTSDPQEFSTLADQRLLSNVLKINRWNIPDEVRANAVNECAKILENDAATPTLKQTVIRNLASLDAINIKFLSLIVPKKVEHIQITDLSDSELRKELCDYIDDLGVTSIEDLKRQLSVV